MQHPLMKGLVSVFILSKDGEWKDVTEVFKASMQPVVFAVELSPLTEKVEESLVIAARVRAYMDRCREVE